MLEFVLNSQWVKVIIILIIFTSIIFTIKMSFTTFLKGVNYKYKIPFFIAFLSFLIQFLILDNKENNEYSQLILLVGGLVFLICSVFLFSARNKIGKKDFSIVIGILMLFQSAISMKISSSNLYMLNIEFAHACIYIGLPAFLIFEISKSDKPSK